MKAPVKMLTEMADELEFDLALPVNSLLDAVEDAGLTYRWIEQWDWCLPLPVCDVICGSASEGVQR